MSDGHGGGRAPLSHGVGNMHSTGVIPGLLALLPAQLELCTKGAPARELQL